MPESSRQAARIHAILPQTQCTRCGLPDCAGYARAIAVGEAEINQCPPGGAEGIARLASVTGRTLLPLNPANGVEGPRAVAVIDENWCIGCTLCIKACPTDAIVGSSKLMHTVIEHYCTGCELCVPVCPVDCISLENITGNRTGWQAWSQAEADQALERYQFHNSRKARDDKERTERLDIQASSEVRNSAVPAVDAQGAEAHRKRGVIKAALARARAKPPR